MSKQIKRDDIVVVIAGEHRGKSGKVLRVDRKKDRVLIESVNVGRKALRPSQTNPQGGLIERERSIHISNVMLEQKYEARHGGSTAAAPADEE